MKAYLIARVSTLEQSDALPGQIYRLKDYADRKRYQYELFEIKESAYKGDRASFKQIIEKVITSQEHCVIVFDKIDRYTRNSNSSEVTILNSLCRAGQIEIHFPSDSLFISKNSSAQEHFMLNMGVSTSQYYSDSISDNVKRRNQQKWRDGEWCGKAPIGYINTLKPDGKKWIEPEPSTARIVRETFEMYASGNYSLRSIAIKWRNVYGYKTVGSSRIDQILKNPFYYGEMRVMGKIYPHTYTPIISRELFEKVKAIREGFKIEPRKWGALLFAYRGLINCAECGCIVTFETTDDTYYSSALHLLELAKNLPELFEKAKNEQKRSILNLIVSNFELDGDLLRYKYKKPFELMASCMKINSWLRRLDSNQRPID